MDGSKLQRLIERTAPPYLAAPWDLSGLQVAAEQVEVKKLAVALEGEPDLVKKALEWGANFILLHHPLSLKPSLPNRLDIYHKILSLLLAAKVPLYSAHTSLDANIYGPGSWMAKELGIENISPIEKTYIRKAITLIWPSLPIKKASLLNKCLPKNLDLFLFSEKLDSPPSGVSINLTIFADDKELVLEKIYTEIDLADALFWEKPNLSASKTYGFGYKGTLSESESFAELLVRLNMLISRSGYDIIPVAAGNFPGQVKNIAVCPGSGASLASAAFKAGADVFITGDVKHHQAQEVPFGKAIVDISHFFPEEEMMRRFAAQLAWEAPDVEVRFFPGQNPLCPVSNLIKEADRP